MSLFANIQLWETGACRYHKVEGHSDCLLIPHLRQTPWLPLTKYIIILYKYFIAPFPDGFKHTISAGTGTVITHKPKYKSQSLGT